MPAISTMTPEQIHLIRQSFDAIWPVRRKLAVTFYDRFFALAPDAQRLFPSDMERQHLKLMDSIAAIVGALDKRDLFQSVVSETGRHHIRLWGEATTFRCVRRGADIGLGTAVRHCLHSRAENSVDDAL
jgi:hemoglobin-like flavoprotein